MPFVVSASRPIFEKIGVSTGPGFTTFRRMPFGASSSASERASDAIAAFVAVLTEAFGIPRSTTVEALITIDEPGFMCGSAFWIVK
jgi:hypothetical protein